VTRCTLGPKKDFQDAVKRDVEPRVQEGVEAVLEEVLEQRTEHLEAGYRELTSTRRWEHNGHYTRDLLTPAGKIERPEIPRDREGEFVIEAFERYERMRPETSRRRPPKDAPRQGLHAQDSWRHRRLELGKDRQGDAVSRISTRLENKQRDWRQRSLEGKAYPYLCLDANYLKVRWGARVASLVLLACVGVNEEGFRGVLVVECAGGQKGEAYASVLRDYIDRGLSGVRLMISDADDHEGIRRALAGELPGMESRRCVVHFARNVLAYVPASSMAEVAEDLNPIFRVRRKKAARALVQEVVEFYGMRFPKAVSVLEAGIREAWAYLSYPGSHHARITSTNTLERLLKEVKRRAKVVGVFPNETSAGTLATEIALRHSEEWALQRYLSLNRLEFAEKPNPQYSRRGHVTSRLDEKTSLELHPWAFDLSGILQVFIDDLQRTSGYRHERPYPRKGNHNAHPRAGAICSL
jgi:putative transposase